jgi:hypothetical protein
MRKLLACLSILTWAFLCLSVVAQTPKKAAPKKSTSAKSTKKTTKKTTKKKGSPSKKSSKASQKAPPRTTWRNRQTTPAPERYKQIQDALVAKGFLDPADAGGAWGPSSADALKRFQAAQNIQPTGKIDALSLIGLGLGPKHD